MSVDFDWKWNDPAHFEAHRKEFSRPVEEVLEELRPRVLELGEEVRRLLSASASRAGAAGGSGGGAAGRAAAASATPGHAAGVNSGGSGAATPDPAAASERRWVHEEWELSAPTGQSGLRAVTPDGSESFWAYRAGRRIPSHLCLGTRELTSWVCLWGWVEPGTFVIHTIYPGRKAPREVHDPDLPLTELPRAIEFWRIHAIITEEGAFSLEPASE